MKDKLIRIFYGAFSVCFITVIISGILKNERFKPQWLIPVIIAMLIIFPLIYYIIKKHESVLDRHYNKILIIFALILFTLEIVTGIILRYDPIWDVGSVQKGAAEWADTGTFAGYYEYYSFFPNNLGAMAFLSVIYRAASLFGIEDYYVVGVVATSAMISVTVVISSLICRRLTNTRNAVFILALFALSAQYWFLGGAVYTDAMTIMFPVLIFWLYLKTKEQEGKKKLLTYLFMGIAAAIGSLIKITVIIMAIAIVIDMCFKNKPKEIAKAAVCITGVVAVVMTCFNINIYSNHLDREVKEKMARPYVHWVMMGLNGNGKYSGADYEFTDSFSDPKEKREMVTKEALRRLKELTVSGGLGKLIVNKSAIDFGDGTYGSTDFFWISPQHDTVLHDWVISDNKHYNKYGTYVSAVQLSIMLLALAGAIMAVFGKNENPDNLLPMYAALFGIWLFLMCWESNRRYFVNFAPVFFVCGSIALDSIYSVLKHVPQKTKNIQKRRKK